MLTLLSDIAPTLRTRMTPVHIPRHPLSWNWAPTTNLPLQSERVKGIDIHPTEPYILTTLYSGHAQIWSYATQQIIKTFELCDVPVRAGRFIARKSWIVCGSDDFQLSTLHQVSNMARHCERLTRRSQDATITIPAKRSPRSRPTRVSAPSLDNLT
jgi:WD40 repeat protein